MGQQYLCVCEKMDEELWQLDTEVELSVELRFGQLTSSTRFYYLFNVFTHFRPIKSVH